MNSWFSNEPAPIYLTNQTYIYIYILLQVVALCQAPFLLDDPNVGLVFPADAIAKARLYLSYTAGGLGNV